MNYEYVSPHFGKLFRGENLLSFQQETLSCGISLGSFIYKKCIDAQKRFLQHSWPKCRPVKGDQVYNIDMLPFHTELTYTLVNSLNCTIFFTQPYHFQKCITSKELTPQSLKGPFCWKLKICYLNLILRGMLI